MARIQRYLAVGVPCLHPLLRSMTKAMTIAKEVPQKGSQPSYDFFIVSKQFQRLQDELRAYAVECFGEIWQEQEACFVVFYGIVKNSVHIVG